jgi:hypothetical protein
VSANDSTDYRALAGDAAEIDAPSDFVSATRERPRGEDARLDLLLPDDLLTEHTLSAPERALLRGVLMNLLHALQLPDRTAGPRRIEELLGSLKNAGGRPARVGETGIPANLAQIDDFDAYFRVHRITSQQPALALVRSLLQTARAVMSLFGRADHLPEARVQQQIAGFIAYTHLLARTFDLGELS